MILRMLKNDLKRNRIITVTLYAFVVLAAMLVSGAIRIILTLSGSMDTLLENSSAAHFAQLHAGTLRQEELDDFAAEHSSLIKSEQTVELLGINGANIYIGSRDASEADSVMENSFVSQNRKFDYLLDTDNRVLQIEDGEIAVPIYHMQKYGLQTGDPVWIRDGEFEKKFTIAAFLRDSLMNPSMINSKRFLVSDGDWKILQEQLGEIEYMIEFQLYDTSRLNELETLYQDSGLPQKGTGMGYSLVKVINGMSDGIVALVIILIAVLLILIAALCLRFTMLTTIEEDYREIGVMKAIGISNQDIRKLYMIKYVVMSAAACLTGYLLSLLVGNLFTANITLYMGAGKQSARNVVFPILGAGIVFAAIVMFCMAVLRRFRRISALEGLRYGAVTGTRQGTGRNRLSKSRLQNVNIFLGIKEVFGHFPVYGLLCFIYILCSFLMIVPLNLLNTVDSSEFITYMGAGKCDLRLDLQQTRDIVERYAETEEYLRADTDVERFTALYTAGFKVKNAEGEYDNLKIEIGDYSVFPLEYAEGAAPKNENEIALSVMNAKEYQKSPGDSLNVIVGNEERKLTVCGIYQDVTNGGKTAKAVLPFDREQVIWFTVNIDLKDGVSLEKKQEEYREMFGPAKVTDVEEYISQTCGGIIEQLHLAAAFAFALAIAVSVLITAMFFKMILTKESRQIAIMKSLGFTVKHLLEQYLTRAILVLLTGIILGTLTAGMLGEKLAGLVITGVSDMHFAVNPFQAYILCPLALASAVAGTVFFSRQTIRRVNVMMAAE